MKAMYSESNTLFEGKFSYDFEWNSDVFFDSKIIVIMLVHNNGSEISRAIDSVLNQSTSVKYGLLLMDDSDSKDWRTEDSRIMTDSRIAIVTVPPLSISQARNIGHYIVNDKIEKSEWICRLDADDELASTDVLNRIYSQLKQCEKTVKWALSGNTLEENGETLDRMNSADSSLATQQGVLKRLEMMAKGDPLGELPSCNLWIRTDFKAVYPNMDSAEDHWLIANLLLNQMDEGILLPNDLHAKYTLSGGITQKNKVNNEYANSRNLLYQSALYWIQNEHDDDTKICLGWGSEGTVWCHQGIITKRFHNSWIGDQGHTEWLGSIDDLPIPSVAWTYDVDHWEARYEFEELQPADEVELVAVSRLIEKCLEKQVVFLNVNRANLRLRGGDLYCIDIGVGIVPFEFKFFRDMCTRLYLLFVQGLTDSELAERTMSFRNKIDVMKDIEGFEQFFHREVHKYAYHNGSFLKPKRDVQQKKRIHNDVTLMVKSCAMEADLIERQAHHIVTQICKFDEFEERVLLLDPKEGEFLRQYTTGNLERLLDVAKRLEKRGVFDRVLVSPFGGHEEDAMELYKRWFDVESSETHNVEGVPVFPQLWGFEQVDTRFLLQMDADVMIGRSDSDDDVITEMKKALSDDCVFGVGFNIPQLNDAEFKTYGGKFVPEVRCGLFDLKRVFKQRPFPNQVHEGKLTTSWYRSIEQFQTETEWGCLRGGDPRSWYIHPPNVLKKDLRYYDRVLDLVEQNNIPDEQRNEWDLIEEKTAWKYTPRNEEIIFCVTIQNWSPHWARACLRSLYIQDCQEWGAVIFDNCSTVKNQRWLASLVEEFDDRFTLVRRRFESIDDSFVKESLDEICTHENPMIVSLAEKEILFDSSIVSRLQEITPEYDSIAAPTYLARQPLGMYFGESDVVSNKSNVPFSIRGQRLSIFCGNNHESIYRDVSGEVVFDIQTMTVYNADMTVGAKDSDDLRPTTYIPNMQKLEIDITYFCNLTCAGCSRSSAQAPSGQHMPIEMIQDFLDESEQKGMKWEALHILGGEPTLHPHFVEIVTLLDDWFMEHSPDTDLKVITNGVSRKVQNNIMSIPEHWRYENSYKLDRELDTSHFEPFNLAPIDLPQWRGEDFTKGCYITQDSGIGLTPYGYFHCAIAGGMERIMNLGHGFDKIPEHPWEFLDMMKDYCRFCGHFLSDAFKERSERIGMDVSPETVSESWQTAYGEWEVKGDA